MEEPNPEESLNMKGKMGMLGVFMFSVTPKEILIPRIKGFN